jgi:hypothetical protein
MYKKSHKPRAFVTLTSDKVSPNFASGLNVLKLPWQIFSNLIIVCCYDNEPTILNIDTACNKLKYKMANSIFHNYVPIIIH